MPYLATVSMIWAFSFGLIGNALSGIDSFAVASIRLFIASLIFLPFLRLSTIPAGQHFKLAGCGAIQFGLMYVCYIKAFAYLPSHLVALFSVLTPLYVVLIHDLRHRRWSPRYLMAAALSVLGAAVIKAKSGNSETLWQGFLLMQIAGISFAFGQVYYRDWKHKHPAVKDRSVFALLYLGGVGLAFLVSLMSTNWATITISSNQWAVLIYLGAIASGLGFFLWNKGATQSTPGILGAFNNAVVPLAMICSLFIFGEIDSITINSILRLLIGGICIFSAVVIADSNETRKLSKQ